jgi:TolB protein
MRRIKRCALLTTAAGLLALSGCGSQDHNSSTAVTTATGSLPRTPRLELAFDSGYALGTADERGGHQRIVIAKARRSKVFPKTAGVSWSPDGSRIAFAAVRGQATAENKGRSDIYSIRPDGGDLRRVTTVGDADAPLWSPSGKQVVFTRSTVPGVSGNIMNSLWSIDADGSRLSEIAAADQGESFMAGSFSPDGAQLAVTRTVTNRETGSVSSEIDLLNADGSDRRTLVENASDPAFSPDGGRIAFASDRDRNGQLCYGDRCFYAGELYVADADGSDPQRLTETTGLNEAHPSWTSDGNRLAYQQGRVFQNAEAFSILEINPDGTCSQGVLSGHGDGPWYASPAWRPSKPETGRGPVRC